MRFYFNLAVELYLVKKILFKLKHFEKMSKSLKGDEDWVKKCMEYRVEGRRPVGRPRKTWLRTVRECRSGYGRT